MTKIEDGTLSQFIESKIAVAVANNFRHFDIMFPQIGQLYSFSVIDGDAYSKIVYSNSSVCEQAIKDKAEFDRCIEVLSDLKEGFSYQEISCNDRSRVIILQFER